MNPIIQYFVVSGDFHKSCKYYGHPLQNMTHIFIEMKMKNICWRQCSLYLLKPQTNWIL